MAWLLTVTTFPLIWVGGLVTTYDAGMAVPDWPGTYGYNLLLYPWQTWIGGPWDLFIEHGHRLLGAFVGVLTIALVVVVYACDPRRWLRRLTLVALAAVILQGCLGGARVLLDARTIALIHGCFGPAFFALCMALCVFTSRSWKRPTEIRPISGAAGLHWLATITCGVAYTQLVLGAVLRHMPASASPTFFRLAVFGHLLVAAVLTGHVALTAWRTSRGSAAVPGLRGPALAACGLLLLQLLLGCGTWVVNYYWPSWIAQGALTLRYDLIEAKGLVQALTVTAHAATGSLLLVTLVLLTLRTLRFVPDEAAKQKTSSEILEGAAA